MYSAEITTINPPLPLSFITLISPCVAVTDFCLCIYCLVSIMFFFFFGGFFPVVLPLPPHSLHNGLVLVIAKINCSLHLGSKLSILNARATECHIQYII